LNAAPAGNVRRESLVAAVVDGNGPAPAWRSLGLALRSQTGYFGGVTAVFENPSTAPGPFDVIAAHFWRKGFFACGVAANGTQRPTCPKPSQERACGAVAF